MQTPMRTALITGASSGIGADLARLMARDRHRLLFVARNVPAMEALAAECKTLGAAGVEIIAADLAKPDAHQVVFDRVAALDAPVDVLVNNAGFGVFGPFADADLAPQLDMIHVNVTALTALTRLFLPSMIRRRSGAILNVGSTAGFVPGPYMSVYFATKAYVLSHSVALAHELRCTGVSVTALCPGPTLTDFQRRAGMERSRLFKQNRVIMTSADVALAGYRGLLAKKLVVVPGATNRVIASLSAWVPRRTLARFTAKLNRAKYARP